MPIPPHLLPNPGSEDAGRLGCVCPVSANYQGMEMPDGGWVTSPKCRLHGEDPDAIGGGGAEPEAGHEVVASEVQAPHPMEMDVVTPEPQVKLDQTPDSDLEVEVLAAVVDSLRRLTRGQQRRVAAYVINRFGAGEE